MHTASTDLRSARASRPFVSLAELSRHSRAEGSCADLQQPLRQLDVCELLAAGASAETSGVIAKKGLGRGVGEEIRTIGWCKLRRAHNPSLCLFCSCHLQEEGSEADLQQTLRQIDGS